MRIDIIECEGGFHPEFPLDFYHPVNYSPPYAIIWENDTFVEEKNTTFVTGIWSSLDYYSELYIKTMAEIWDTNQLIIGMDNENNRFFAVGFLNPKKDITCN